MIFNWPIIGFLTWQLTKPTNRDQQQHSELEGAGFLRQLWSVTLGGKKSLLFSLFLIAMVMIMGELSASQLVVPPGMDTLPRLTLGLMHSGVDEMTAAINLLTLTLIVTIAAPGILNFARQGQ
jgi:iron(III) transport system permease protein